MSDTVIVSCLLAVILLLILWAVAIAVIRSPYRQSFEAPENNLAFDPLWDQITLFFVGVVASWLMLLTGGILLGWSWPLLFKWGYSPFWYLIGVVQMVPPAIHAVIIHMRYPNEVTKWWQRPLPAALSIIWLLIGQWISELWLLVLVLAVIAMVLMLVWWSVVG